MPRGYWTGIAATIRRSNALQSPGHGYAGRAWRNISDIAEMSVNMLGTALSSVKDRMVGRWEPRPVVISVINAVSATLLSWPAIAPIHSPAPFARWPGVPVRLRQRVSTSHRSGTEEGGGLQDSGSMDRSTAASQRSLPWNSSFLLGLTERRGLGLSSLPCRSLSSRGIGLAML